MQPQPKRKSPVARTSPVLAPLPQAKPKVKLPDQPQANAPPTPPAASSGASEETAVIVEEIPVVGIELSTGDAVTVEPQNSNPEELDRR